MVSTTCGRCGRLTHMTAVTREFDEASAYEIEIKEQVFKCDNCSRLSLRSSVRKQRSQYQVKRFRD